MTQLPPRAAFLISLDFELHWGVRERLTVEDYKENLLGVRQAIPAMLRLFEKYEIHATWATVGFLFCGSRDELLASAPEQLPQYDAPSLSPYPQLASVGCNEAEDPFHFAPSLIDQIAASPHQELGTHTLSHFYCLEGPLDLAALRQDLAAAQRLAARRRLELRSIVFPRNQYSAEHLKTCAQLGFTAYRGTESSWIYNGLSRQAETRARRALRLLDAYMSLTGNNCFPLSPQSALPCNLPSSRFLRPYSPVLGLLEPLRLRRILNGLDYAAEHSMAYHLWWHPHNFGVHLPQNLAFLEKILMRFSRLRDGCGMASLSMGEMAERLAAAPAAALP